MNPKIASALALALIALHPAPRLLAASAAPAQGDPVALVVWVAGKATAQNRGGREERPLVLFDKLPAGVVLSTGPGSTLRVVLRGGARYALRERSSARLDRSGLRSLAGSVDRLTPLPAVLVLAPIAPEDEPGDRFPSLIIRTQEIAGVYPRGVVNVEPAKALLHFEPVSGAPTYRIVVTDQHSGNPVYTLETQKTEVLVPGALLKPGHRYTWSVETVGRIGAKAEGHGGFVTSTPEADAARAKLDQILAGEPELDGLLLKIAVDLNLGHYREVYEGLREAARRLPEDPGLARAERDWAKRLESRETAEATPPASHPSSRSPTPSSSGGKSSW